MLVSPVSLYQEHHNAKGSDKIAKITHAISTAISLSATFGSIGVPCEFGIIGGGKNI